MILKIIGIGLCGVIINMILRGQKPEIAILCNICAGLMIFSLLTSGVKDIVEEFMYIKDISGVKLDVITPIVKVIGIGYITEFAADIAEESGNKSIANKVVMGGKVAICILALPVIKSLINAILSII